MQKETETETETVMISENCSKLNNVLMSIPSDYSKDLNPNKHPNTPFWLNGGGSGWCYKYLLQDFLII